MGEIDFRGKIYTKIGRSRYRNTIKALNWYSSVREKLDDPKYVLLRSTNSY